VRAITDQCLAQTVVTCVTLRLCVMQDFVEPLLRECLHLELPDAGRWLFIVARLCEFQLNMMQIISNDDGVTCTLYVAFVMRLIPMHI
jgi:hypothetical protein